MPFAARRKSRSTVRECLTEQQFQVFRRREAHGRPLKTVAAELGLTAVETARLFYQAQHLLRDKLPNVNQHDDTPAGRLKQLLRGLPDRQRQAIELKHGEGYSLKEIGEVMECTPGAVGAEIYRGMKALGKT